MHIAIVYRHQNDGDCFRLIDWAARGIRTLYICVKYECNFHSNVNNHKIIETICYQVYARTLIVLLLRKATSNSLLSQ